MAEIPMPVCELCEKRRARRDCPGIRGQICSICCGAEREVTISCPLDCPYLEEARRHERPAATPEQEPPSADIELSDAFLEENSHLLTLAAGGLLEAALQIPGAVDADVRDALASLVRTWRTLESGLYYETFPTNPVASLIHQSVCRLLNETRDRVRRQQGYTPYRDADVLRVLVHLQQLEFYTNNGRPRGRAFIDFLRHNLSRNQTRDSGSILLLP